MIKIKNTCVSTFIFTARVRSTQEGNFSLSVCGLIATHSELQAGGWPSTKRLSFNWAISFVLKRNFACASTIIQCNFIFIQVKLTRDSFSFQFSFQMSKMTLNSFIPSFAFPSFQMSRSFCQRYMCCVIDQEYLQKQTKSSWNIF